MKLLTLVFGLAFAFTSHADQADSQKLAKWLGSKKIVCVAQDHSKQVDFPVSFVAEKDKVAVEGQKSGDGESIYDDDHPEVEISKTWIVLSLSSDATILKEFHLRYQIDKGKLDVLYGVFDNESDGALSTLPLDCDLK